MVIGISPITTIFHNIFQFTNLDNATPNDEKSQLLSCLPSKHRIFQITHNTIKIDSNEALIANATFEGWIGNGTKNNPFIIQGYKFITTNYERLIHIENTSLYLKIKNCTIYGGLYGIYLRNVSNTVIHNNTITDMRNYGIYSSGSFNNTISSNYFTNCDIAIRIAGGTELIMIKNNYINLCRDSILCSSINNSVIQYNNIYNNSGTGIHCHEASNLLICNNNITENKEYGIDLDEVVRSNITSNNFENNGLYGIKIEEDCFYLNISNNRFINNQKGAMLINKDPILDNNHLINDNYEFSVHKQAEFLQQIFTLGLFFLIGSVISIFIIYRGKIYTKISEIP